MSNQTQNQTPAPMHSPGQKSFRTADLYYAAYLSVAGVDLLDARKEDRRVYFYFADEGQITDLKKQYHRRQSKVSALTYAEEIKNFKNQTHEIMQGG